MNDDDYSAASSGRTWSPNAWNIRHWATVVGSYGVEAARQLCRTADDKAACDAAVELLKERRDP